MIRQLELHNFRGIADGAICNLTKLVVLVGPNGSGKSSLIDGLLIAGVRDPTKSIQPACNRRPPDGQAPRWLVRGGTGTGSVAVDADDGWHRTVKLVASEGGVTPTLEATRNDKPTTQEPNRSNSLFQAGPPPLNIRLVEPVQTGSTKLADLYTRVAEQGRRREAKALIIELIPNLEDIEILTQNGEATVYLVFSDGAHPAALAGDGVHLLLKLGLELSSRTGGTVLLEEPDTHMHPGAIRQVAKAIWAAVRRGIQVILTTHSLDLIDAIVAEATTDDLTDLALYQIRTADSHLKSSRLDGSDVAFSRAEIQDDLR